MRQVGGHPNVVDALAIYKDEEIVTYKRGKKLTQHVNAMVLERGKVDLFTIINKIEKFSEKTCRFLFKQLLSGLSHVHSRGIAHCDLKLENIIFDHAGNLKLIDFGLSHKI